MACALGSAGIEVFLLHAKILIRKFLPKSRLIRGFLGAISDGFSALWRIGTSVLQMPIKLFKLCIEAQKMVLFLPFRCASGIYRLFRSRSYLAVPDTLTFLTGGDSSSDKIIAEMRELTRASLMAICEGNAKNQLRVYQKELESWKPAGDVKEKELYKLSSEEKDLMHAIAAALRYLNSLKLKKDRLSASLNENAMNAVTTGRQANLKSWDHKANGYQVTNFGLEERSFYIKLLKNSGQTTCDILSDQLSKSRSISETQTQVTKSQHLPDGSVDITQKIVALVSDESFQLKGRLASTADKLEEVVRVSENLGKQMDILGKQLNKVSALSQEMEALQKKLDEGQALLYAVEADRDRMKANLQTLESMIKEEEEYLADAFSSTSENGDSSSHEYQSRVKF